MKEIILLVLGAFLGSFLTMIGNRKHAERQRFIEESVKFRLAFAPAINDFENHIPGNDRDILRDHFDTQQAAFNRFTNFIPKRKQSSFSDVWKKYKDHCTERNSGGIITMIASEALDPNRMNDPQHILEVAEMRNKQALDHINNLLKYTK